MPSQSPGAATGPSSPAPEPSARIYPRLPLVARTDQDHEEHRQATWLELFFDLCFVVAIAALARAFHDNPTWDGALIYVGLFLPVWWAWMGFAWFSNTFDNDDVPYRVVVFGAMLASVWLATSVGSAAQGESDAYALAYIGLSTLLLALMIRALRDARHHAEDYWQRLISGYLTRYAPFQISGIVLWGTSLAFDEPTRYVLWGVGLGLQLYGPAAAIRPFWTDDHTHDRMFHFDHIRERYGLFTIIVLGESILAVSIGVSEVGWDATSMLTASLAFLVAVSIWWTYFDRSGRAALSRNIMIAFTWGYGHFAIFAGIAAIGVGAELLIEAAGEPDVLALAATEPVAGSEGGAGPGPGVYAGGLVAFIAGMMLINLSNLGFRITGIGVIIVPMRIGVAVGVVAVAWIGTLSPLGFTAVAAIAMVSLNAAETALAMRFRRRMAFVEVAEAASAGGDGGHAPT